MFATWLEFHHQILSLAHDRNVLSWTYHSLNVQHDCDANKHNETRIIRRLFFTFEMYFVLCVASHAKSL